MPIPSQTDMFPFVLQVMTDGKTRSNKEITEAVARYLKLTEDELDAKTSSGQAIHASRSAWGVQYLQRAQLLDRVSRGVYKINQEGMDVAAKNLNGSDFSKLLNHLIAERNPWNASAENVSGGEQHTAKEIEATGGLSPQESIEQAIFELRSTLADELLDQIMSKSPQFFEKIVVDLLVKMGYGSGTVTQYSNDGGIDGMISTDALGFDPIYTQAKRYSFDHTVGRPEVQAFAGALGRYTRGVFITTSNFAQSAIEYAKNYPHSTIVLIDGRRLADLMIQYDLGVSTEKSYSIKRIDIDYFDQD